MTNQTLFRDGARNDEHRSGSTKDGEAGARKKFSVTQIDVQRAREELKKVNPLLQHRVRAVDKEVIVHCKNNKLGAGRVAPPQARGSGRTVDLEYYKKRQGAVEKLFWGEHVAHYVCREGPEFKKGQKKTGKLKTKDPKAAAKVKEENDTTTGGQQEKTSGVMVSELSSCWDGLGYSMLHCSGGGR